MSEEVAKPYQVLARKYRPQTFEAMIGQEVLVDTLSNAIKLGRLAQAFMLTGIRGVGKTTTARLIARALNCVGPDGQGGPTISPCGVCDSCTSISEDRHVDVLEIDAASHTGVNDMREVIDAVRYRPVSARYKIYIIDEVHMLSTSAFNALLKTLEEPPAHVKFIFATTEIRKVPVTVLSRCQRFDLRRVPVEILMAHFKQVAETEGQKITDAALQAIARAAEGSVRDGLSLLDTAFARCDGEVDGALVQDMLGLADRGKTLDLLEKMLSADVMSALSQFEDLYAHGADPAQIIQELLSWVHWLTRLKLAPQGGAGQEAGEDLTQQGQEIVTKIGIARLTQAWQLLLKGLQEVQMAPLPYQATEMVFIRFMHTQELPPPGDLARLVRQMQQNGGTAMMSGAPQGGAGGVPRAMAVGQNYGGSAPVQSAAPAMLPQKMPENFEQVVALFEQQKEPMFAEALKRQIHVIDFQPGKMEVRLAENGQQDKEILRRLQKQLSLWTGRIWQIDLGDQQGDDTLKTQLDRAREERFQRANDHELVAHVLKLFPGAELVRVQEEQMTEISAEAIDNDPDISDITDNIDDIMIDAEDSLL